MNVLKTVTVGVAVAVASVDVTYRAAYESYWSGRDTVLRGTFTFET